MEMAMENYETENDMDELAQLIVNTTVNDIQNPDIKMAMHRNICKELNDTYEKKNHDYGDSFGETYKKLGIISAITRISDKYNRLVTLCTLPEEERKVKDESISDTLLDMANYCIMTEIELRKNKTLNN